MKKTFPILAFAILVAGGQVAAGPIPSYDHIVVVIEENHSYSDIIGNSNAPYINQLASNGALFTNSHGVEHPSQPNYLDLFSGSNQGVTDDHFLDTTRFTSRNLAASLFASGRSFAMYSESLPSVGYTGKYDSADGSSQLYARKHNPYVDWQVVDPRNPLPNSVPVSGNQPFSAFPTDFTKLPTVSFVAPNQTNDMHGVPPYTTPDATLIKNGDNWLANGPISAYATWAKAHNSLLVVTWDEDDYSSNNHIPTIFYGAGVQAGQYAEAINHFNLLRTLEDAYQLPLAGASANAAPILSPFAVPEPTSLLLLAIGGLGGLVLRRR